MKQSLNLIIVNILLSIISSIIVGITSITSIGMIISLIILIFWILGIINAVKQNQTEIPLVGEFAEKYLTF